MVKRVDIKNEALQTSNTLTFFIPLFRQRLCNFYPRVKLSIHNRIKS